MLFGEIASVYFIWKIYLYLSIGNGQTRKPALCQLYRHIFAPYRCVEDLQGAAQKVSTTDFGQYFPKLTCWRNTCLWSARLIKISISKFQDGGCPPSRKSKNCNISWWWRTGTWSVSVVGHLGFLKLKFLTGGALERHVSHHLSHFEEIDHTVAAIAIFRMKCKNSLDDRA